MSRHDWGGGLRVLFAALARFSFGHHRAVLTVAGLASVAALPLLPGLAIDTDFHRLVDSDHPLLAPYMDSMELFGSTTPLFLLLDAHGGEQVPWQALLHDLNMAIAAHRDVTLLYPSPDWRDRVQAVALRLRAALLNSPPDVVQELLARCQPAAMERAIRRTRAHLIATDDPALRQRISADVLGVLPLVAPFYQARMGETAYSSLIDGGDDPRRRILVLQPHRSAEDTAYCSDLISRLDASCRRVLADHGLAEEVALHFAGLHAITAHSAGVLQRDMLRITAASVLLLGVLLVATLRPVRVALVCFVPMVVSILLLLVVARVFCNPVYFLTIGFAAVVLGLGLDSGLHLSARLVHFLADDSVENAVCRTAGDSGPPIAVGILSTTVALAALFGSGKAGIAEFAGLTVVGLLLSFAVTMLVFPALIRGLFSTDSAALRQARLRILPPSFFCWLVTHRRLAFAAGLILVAACIPAASRFSLDIRAANLFPRDSAAWATTTMLEEELGTSFSDAVQLSIEAPSLAAAMHRQRAIDEQLAAAVQDGTIGLFDSPGVVFPYRSPPPELAAAARAFDDGGAAFFDALRRNGFKVTDSHRAYVEILAASLRGADDPLERARATPELARYAAPVAGGVRLQTSVWPADTGQGDSTTASSSSAAVVRDLVVGQPHAGGQMLITGTTDMLERLQAVLADELVRISGIAFALVVLCVWAFFRRPADVLISLLPLAGALTVLLAAVVLLHIPITPVSMVFGAIVFGVGIDDAVHVLARIRSTPGASLLEVLPEIGPAITLTTLSTAVGFGSLMLSSHPVVSSLGAAITIGVVACWLFTLLLLPALLGRRRAGSSLAALVIILAATAATPGWATEAEAERILTGLRQHMDGIEAVSCHFSQIKRIDQLSDPVRLEGTVVFQQPGWLKLEMRGDASIDLCYDGATLTMVNHDLDEVESHSLDELAAADHPMSPLVMAFRMEEVANSCTLSTVGSRDTPIVRLVPHAPQHQLASIELAVNEPGRLRWSRVRYRNGDMVDTIFDHCRRERALPVESFRCPDPERTENAGESQ